LVAIWKGGTPGRVDARLQEMPVHDLKLMAHELGLSFASKPSRKSLMSAVIGRINESVMLSRNTNVTPSRTEQMRKAKDTSEGGSAGADASGGSSKEST
jgi:hypothetical protein